MAQTLSSLSLSPTSGFGGSTNVTGTVTLTSAATATTTITLASSNQTDLTVPASVSVSTGSTSATFVANSHTTTAVVVVTVTATYSGVNKTATFTDNPTAISSVSFSPTSVTGGGANSTGTVQMTGAVGSAQTITLTSSNTGALTVPASVSLAAGTTSVTFTATSNPVATTAAVTVTASYNGGSKTGTVTVLAPALSGVAVSPGSVTSGTSATGTVMLTGNVASGSSIVVTLTSSNTAAATVPASVTIPAGSSSATFPVTTSTVTTATNVTLTATYSSVSKTTVLTVNPAASTSLRIDTGATATYTDSLGNVWAADTDFTGGTVDAPGSPPSIANTADPKLFQTQRVETTAGSKITYTLPIANGTYSLNLLFAEIDGKTTGQRVFGVTANGTALLTGFDIYAAAGGANKAVTKSFLVTVTTGQISLVLTGTTGQAAISAVSLVAPGGGTPVADIPPPGWAEEVIPSDQSDAGGNGPSASLSVSLPSGVLENHPGPDLDVFNSTGPSISYERLYRSALATAGTYTPGLSPGWRDNYSLTITNKGGGSYALNYPNGGADNWTTVSSVITPASGTPYLVSVSGSNLVLTFKDHSSYTFTPDPNNANSYLLTGLSNLVGSTVMINRDAANGSRITTFTNGGSSPLLTLNYSGTALANITDVYGRVVTYTFSGTNLSTVSQVNAASAIRWQYGYTTIGTKPFLNAVMVPDPSSGTMSQASPQYTPSGYVAALLDAEGNQRTYTYGPKAVSVSVYGAANTLTQTWTQKFDSTNHNVDKGVIDAYGHATSLAYGDAANPLKVTGATNKNGQTANATFDKYGNTSTLTDLRSVQTQNTYDPAFPLGQVTEVLLGANESTPKTPTNFTYYDGTTQVNSITQAKGLVKTMSVPTPGTVGTGAQVTSTYAYTALGDVLMVASPAPSTSGGTVTTTYNYTSDPTYDVNGNAGTYTAAEQLGQPLTITDPLGNVTHFRYDPRGNAITIITPPVVSYPDTTTARGLRTDYAYNRYDQLTGVMYPPTNPATPAARATAIYTYEYEGGPLQGVTYYDESGTQVRTASKGDGKEDEQKSQAGSVQQANYNYDPRYRLTQKVDGVHSQPAQSFGYDGVGNLTSQTYALGDGPQFTQYDNDNNLMQMKDGRSVSTTYARAADDSRITGVTYSDGTPSVSFGTSGSGYDVYDRVTSFSDGAGSYTASYDDDDNLLSKTTTYTGLPSVMVSYSYNNDGSRATLTTPKLLSGSTYSYWTFSYTYDNDGRLTDVACPWQQSQTSMSAAHLSYYYDNDGRLIKTHTRQMNTYSVHNARGFLVELQHANGFSPGSFMNGDGTNPPAGTISNAVAQGSGGDTINCLLDDYLMQYDSVGNRTQTAVTIPDFWQYTNGTSPFSFPTAPDVDGTLFYSYDIKDRLSLETTYNSGNTPTMEDYSTGGGGELYNDNWNYPTGGDLADNLTTIRGNAQTFNADDQLTGQTYDGEGNQTSYNGGTMAYDAEDRPTFVPGNSGNGTTGFTQLFTGEGLRAWKLPSGGSKTYYLYDGDQALMELDSSGNPVITYAYGADGLQERYQHTNTGVPFIVYLFDPNGNLVHRIGRDDPNTGSGQDAVFVRDVAIYDSQGLLHADIDTVSGGFNASHLDPVGYKGQSGQYTDLETLQAVSGLYTALSGPVGANFYNPLSGVGMARSQADSINAYLDNLNPLAGYTFGQYAHDVGQFGIGEGKAFGNAIVGGAVDTGKLALDAAGPAGMLIADQVPPGWSSPFAASGNPMQQSGLATGNGIALVGSVAAIFVGDPEGVETLAGAESRIAGKGCFVAGTLVQMADGTTKPIEQVKAGDFVKSRNPQTGLTEAKRVVQTTIRQTNQVLTLALTDPKTGRQEIITTTGEHPFFVDGKGFVKAGELGIGTSIVTRAGPMLALNHLTWQNMASNKSLLLDGGGQPTGYTVYNLIVDGDHTYFVGTVGGGAWVHNVDCDLNAVAKEIHNAGYSRDSTSAVIEAEKDGQIYQLAGTSTGKLSSAQRRLIGTKNLVPISGARVGDEHAEELIIRLGQQQGYTFNGGAMGASRRICLDCEIRVARRYGLRSHTPFSGRFSRKRLQVLRDAANELSR